MDDWEWVNGTHTRANKPPWKAYKEKRAERQGGGHVMSKPEAKVMRRIQAETGMTEEQIRSYKKYRIMLSRTQEPGRMDMIRRREFHAKQQESWSWGSEKGMFKQRAQQLLDDKEMTAELYKRYAGGFVDCKRPKAFHYRKFEKQQLPAEVLKAIAKTDGQYYYSVDQNEVGFMYETSMLMFTLAFQEKQ